MLEKLKKYFPSTISGAEKSIQNVQQSFQKPAYVPSSIKKPNIKKPDIKKPLDMSSFNIESIKSYLKKKFPDTAASISSVDKISSPLANLPSAPGSEGFVTKWKRRKEREHNPGWRTYDFFPELFYLAPMKYSTIGAAPNFPEIQGHTKYKMKFGFSLKDSIEGGSIGAGIKFGIDTTRIPGIYKSGGFNAWSSKTHGALMSMSDEKLIKVKQNRMAYWKNEMENADSSSGKARARWNYYNIKHRALKNYYELPKEDAQVLIDEWKRFSNSRGMYENNIWHMLAGAHEIQK